MKTDLDLVTSVLKFLKRLLNTERESQHSEEDSFHPPECTATLTTQGQSLAELRLFIRLLLAPWSEFTSLVQHKWPLPQVPVPVSCNSPSC